MKKVHGWIQIEHVEAAVKLLDAQIESKNYTHRCLGLEVLRREESLEKIKKTGIGQFFQNYIQYGQYYNEPVLFRTVSYDIPKGDGGVRKYYFLEAHMRILYYALGYYFYDLTREMESQLNGSYRKRKIFTYYGANIRFDAPEKSEIFYQSDYKKFTAGIREEVDSINGSKVAVLHLDIQDFYATIDHDKLVERIGSLARFSDKQSLRFTDKTHEQIKDLLLLAVGRTRGLPLTRQNIMSNFIANLFIRSLDKFVSEICRKYPGCSFHRYVDDMYLIIPFKSTTENSKIGAEMLGLSTRIGAFLSSKLGLVLNPLKTRLTVLESKKSAEDFVKKQRLVSFSNIPTPKGNGKSDEEMAKATLDKTSDEYVLDVTSLTPEQRLKETFRIITSIADEFNNSGQVKRLEGVEIDILNSWFSKRLFHYLVSKTAQKALIKMFSDWPPVLFTKAARVLVYLVSRDGGMFKAAMEDVLKNYDSTHDDGSLITLYIAEQFILSDGYGGEFRGLLEELLKNEEISSYLYAGLLYRLEVPNKPISKILFSIDSRAWQGSPALIEQVRLFVVSKKMNLFSVAFNHLLNMLQEWVYFLFGGGVQRKNFDRNSVLNCLDNIVDIDELETVVKIFDRRNKNAISHPGEQDEVSVVSLNELVEFEKAVNRIFVKVASRLYRVIKSVPQIPAPFLPILK